MITSMTGFGSAEGRFGGARLNVEVRAVNHRFFNPTIKLPNAIGKWEGDVRDALRRRFVRGHVTLSARLEHEADNTLSIDEARFGAYVEQLRSLSERFGLDAGVDVATVMRLPEVVTSGAQESQDQVSAGTLDELLAIVNEAASALDAMRRIEGKTIAEFLHEHLDVVEGALGRVAQRAPARLTEQRERLRASVAELAAGVAVDPQRLAQEIAIMADRLDVSEELSRFDAHIAAFRATIAAPGEAGVGKRLGFLLQEMLREANTTGSKANDAAIVAEVVSIKEELERLREQSENVE